MIQKPQTTQPTAKVFRKLSEMELETLDIHLSNLVKINKSQIGAKQVFLEKKGAIILKGTQNDIGYWGDTHVISREKYDEAMEHWSQWHDWPRRTRFDDLIKARFPNAKLNRPTFSVPPVPKVEVVHDDLEF